MILIGADLLMMRLYILIQGAVQGVGFRPFIYRLATELELGGWVNNSAQGVVIEVEGSKQQLETFLEKIESEKPPLAIIKSIESSWLKPIGYNNTFEIHDSVEGEKTAIVLPDIATCPDCLREIFDSTNRRYHYPFTNCTNCGPRYTIIQGLPYDRKNTTMKAFGMCPQCQAEYGNPLDRRFHAQPNACPQCGPHLELWDNTGKVCSNNFNALQEIAEAIRQGKIVALKGLGGFHLIVDARNEEAVQTLRQRKHRPDKPFALMYPSLDLIKAHCEVSDLEEQLLQSPEAPIVLLKSLEYFSYFSNNVTHHKIPIAPSVAPGNPYLGVMLPYTPLHHLLMAELGFPIVATSGNLADEPICITQLEAIERLAGIAALFLIHNRPIVRPVDDSVVKVVASRPLIIRRARGYAPLPIYLQGNSSLPHILAVGGHFKNTIAISLKNEVFISQHLGDLSTIQAFQAFQKAIKGLSSIYEFDPKLVACDAHPDYLSTQFAQQLNLPLISVQHHYAHVLSCMADNQLEAPVLGISWDGTGYGLDGTIWGGEFLYLTSDSFERVAHLRTFRLPGGKKAVKQPCRIALGLLYELFGDEVFTMKHLAPIQAFSLQELAILKTMLGKNLNTPMTSSIGRLFDAIASIVGIRQKASFEGQAAMELEFALEGIITDQTYPLEIQDRDEENSQLSLPLSINFAPILLAILEDINGNVPLGVIAAKFHNTLVETIITVANILNTRGLIPNKQVVLTGGCFQNKYLTEQAIKGLQKANFIPYWHKTIPPNDGGIALGQLIAALRTME